MIKKPFFRLLKSNLDHFLLIFLSVHEKNTFVEVSKNLGIDTDLKIILSDCQNNYIERSSIMSNAAKKF